MKKTLKIEQFEDKKAVNGKLFTRFKTNEGWMSCFDSETSEQLKLANPSDVAILDILEVNKGDKTYYNIIKLIELKEDENYEITKEKVITDSSKVYEPMKPMQEITKTAPSMVPPIRNGTDKNCELMTAKEIFVKLLDEGIDVTKAGDESKMKDLDDKVLAEVMKSAVKLVQQARKELE